MTETTMTVTDALAKVTATQADPETWDTSTELAALRDLAVAVGDELAQPSGRIPARVGSPAMEVIAAIPIGTAGRECACVVLPRGSDNPAYGVVSAYLSSGDPFTWHATGGHYDFARLTSALHDMARRAGVISEPAHPDADTLSEISDALQDACAAPEDTLARIERAMSQATR